MESHHGSEFYEDEAARDRYLKHRHDGLASPNAVMEEPAFLETVAEVEGKRVLDLGCGDGRTAELLLSRGAAAYVGVDASAGMIDLALRSSSSLRDAEFIHHSIEGLGLGDERFDVVVSRMALHYVEGLDDALGLAARLLVEGGRLIFSVVHPTITSHDNPTDGLRSSWIVDDYFVRGPRERPWFGAEVTWYHRTIEDYVREVVRAGFRIDVLSECEPSATLLAELPEELARRRRVPLMLLIGATKQALAGSL